MTRNLPQFARIGSLVFLTAALAWCGTLRADDEPTTVLGIEGSHFTLNGRPTFLLGISYYGALGAPEVSILKDLDDVTNADSSCALTG